MSVTGLTKMAVARMKAHYERYGIDDAMIDMARRYERMIAVAKGESVSIDGLGQRCLNREPGTTACLLPVDHKEDCDLRLHPSFKREPNIVYDDASAAYRLVTPRSPQVARMAMSS
jgi:hypothetical protein